MFVVNAIFVYFALTTFSGGDTSDPYRKGLHYNDTLRAAERQAERGWQTDVAYDGKTGRLELSFLDKNAAPITGLTINGKLSRPATDKEDRHVVLAETSQGIYAADCQPHSRAVGAFRSFAQGGFEPRDGLSAQAAPVRGRDAMTVHAPADRLTQTAKSVSPAETSAMLTLAIENMHCGGCLRSVERAALEVPGVQDGARLPCRQAGQHHLRSWPRRRGRLHRRARKRAGFAAAAIEAAKQNRDDCAAELSACGAWRWRALPP